MSKTLNIQDIIYRGRIYSHEDEQLYFNKNDFTIHYKIDLLKEFKLTESDLGDINKLQFELSFIPLFQVNIPMEMKKYLSDINNKNITVEIRNLSLDQVYVYFQKYTEINYGERLRWIKYEKETLESSAMEWCKLNYIPYKM